MQPQLDLWTMIRDTIDMRSFDSIWYWMAVAVVWSSSSHFVLGVPFDMVIRARRRGGQAERDLEDLVRINVNRLTNLEARAGAGLMGFAAFLLTVLGLLGFVYGVEFSQAVFLIGAPMVPVGFVTFAAARRIAREAPRGQALRKRLGMTRLWIQLIGMAAIFVTAMWGAYQTLVVDSAFI